MQTVNVTDMLVKSLVCLTIFLMTLALGGYASAEMLGEGTRAPDFTLKNQDGSDVTLSQEIKKGHVVLYFYPERQHPGLYERSLLVSRPVRGIPAGRRISFRHQHRQRGVAQKISRKTKTDLQPAGRS